MSKVVPSIFLPGIHYNPEGAIIVLSLAMNICSNFLNAMQQPQELLIDTPVY